MENAITSLIQKQGTPFYLFDEVGFIENYNRLESTFRSVYPNYRICYSYKTNYTPFICNIVKKLGGLAEVVSDMEYELAIRLGYSNCQIVYNGPSKGERMFEHMLNGGIINIDSYDEAKRIVNFSNQYTDKMFKCGIRINMDLGGDFISRFGLEPNSEAMYKTVDLIRSQSNLSIVGVHCHISRSRGYDAWAKRSEIMLRMADEIIEGVPEYISLGSGMFADMSEYLRCQFGASNIPTYEDYCRACIEPVAKHYADVLNKPMLYTEPGTTLVARYLSFVSKVLSIKNIRGRWVANMDGDYHNLGEICTMKKLPTFVIPSNHKKDFYESIDIMGFTCLEQDVMVPSWSGELSEDDCIVFENVGGYSIVSKPQFIKPQCAMYAKTSNGHIKQIMRAETFDDVFGKFNFDFK